MHLCAFAAFLVCVDGVTEFKAKPKNKERDCKEKSRVREPEAADMQNEDRATERRRMSRFYTERGK